MLPCEDIFIQVNNNKRKSWGEIGWMGVGYWGLVVFGLKLLNIQHGVDRCTCKSFIMEWANMLKESSKQIHWGWKQFLTTTPASALIQMGSWNTHLVRDACVLQGACPPGDKSGLFGPSSYVYAHICITSQCISVFKTLVNLYFLNVTLWNYIFPRKFRSLGY